MAWFGSWLVDFSILVGVVSAFLYFRFKRAFTHWEKQGVFHTQPTIPFGHLKETILKRKSMGEHFKDLYFEYKKNADRYGGIYFFTLKVFMVWDPELIKHVMTKDFQFFPDRGTRLSDEKYDPLSAHLFSLDGYRWRNLRAKLSPTFTSGKMKMMFPTLVKCGEPLKELMDNNIRVGEPIDIKDVLARYTTDIIGSCAFGIECNSLQEPDNDFRKFGKKSFQVTTSDSFRQTIMFNMPKMIQDWAKFSLNKPDVTKFFMDIVRETVDYREKHVVKRNDFMQLLLQLKNDGKIEDDKGSENAEADSSTTRNYSTKKLTFNEIAAQCFLFFRAGFETSSTTMTFCLYELCRNQEIQEKLRQEAIETLKKDNGQITYDSIMHMPYMDRVVSETLRKYPPVPVLMRKTVSEYEVPDSDIVLPKGQMVWIPVHGIQRDPEYYPDPMKFDPERFTEENKAKRHPYTYLPFGEGPRNCIGMRFGLMQTKAGLTLLLSNYRFKLNPKTVDPLVLDPLAFISAAKGDIWLDAEKI